MMRSLLSAWGRAAVVAVMVVVAGCGNSGPGPTRSATPPRSPSTSLSANAQPSPASGQLSPSSPAAPATPAQVPTAVTPDLTKQPFTVLLLGADDGFRTDSIIVAGIDPVNRRVGLVSLPRDTIDVPIPGGGTFRQQKVNAFYGYAAANPEKYPQGPGRAVADMMQELLGVRIDFYAATTFSGFTRLIDLMGGVRIDVPTGIVDPTYQLPSGQFGIRFKAGLQTMDGPRALVYTRTRHADSDFGRSRRQQAVLAAAGRQLLASPDLLAALVSGSGNLITDFPLGQVPALVTAMAQVSADGVTTGLVLGPSTYSSNSQCVCGYALKPNVSAMQRAAAKLFPWAVITP